MIFAAAGSFDRAFHWKKSILSFPFPFLKNIERNRLSEVSFDGRRTARISRFYFHRAGIYPSVHPRYFANRSSSLSRNVTHESHLSILSRPSGDRVTSTRGSQCPAWQLPRRGQTQERRIWSRVHRLLAVLSSVVANTPHTRPAVSRPSAPPTSPFSRRSASRQFDTRFAPFIRVGRPYSLNPSVLFLARARLTRLTPPCPL